MAGVQALILAAGRGSRLGDSGHEVPKCLLEIGRRRLIEHQIEALADAGVGPVHLVVGYGAEEVREIVGMRAKYVVNTRWEKTNSIYSFWLAREAVQGDVMILNSDVLFAPEVIGRLLDQPGDAVAIDSSSGEGREQMKVGARDGRVIEMSKDLPADRAIGENVGILKLTRDTAAATFERAGQLIASGLEQSWLGAAINDIAPQRDLHAVDVAGLPWVEIDFAPDLARARKEVWPAIEGGAYRRRRLVRNVAWVVGVGLLIGALYVGSIVPPPGATPATEWESVAIADLEHVHVSLGDYSQDWWVLEEGAVAAVEVQGGGTVRLESRLLDPASDNDPYVLEIGIDGERLDWFKLVTRPSGKAKHPNWVIGHKKRFTIEIPDDARRLEARLIAPEGATCLFRVRQIVTDAEE
jgi:choline kinase